MNQRSQRSLRPRKPYPYLPPDTQDPDQVRYPRLNYNKVSMPLSKQMVSPAMELNSNAKILVKFFNNTNKALRQFRRIEESQIQPLARNEPPPVDKYAPKIKNMGQTSRKGDGVKKTQKEDQNKKEKEPNHLKTFSSHLNGSKGAVRSDLGNRNHDSKFTYQQPMFFANGEALLAQMIPHGMNYDPKMFANLQLPENPMQAAEKARAQQKNFFYNPQLYQNQNRKQNLEQSVKNGQTSSKQKENKLFGRSAYHVAIAYHIHLKKIKQQGDSIKNSEVIDPTYCARKLKGDKNYTKSEMEPEQ